jgi:signal transduction histidine kinase
VVRYEAGATHARLVIQDAGDGSVGVMDGPAGFGVLGMRERAHSIGASFAIGTSRAGTSVVLSWPATAT